MLFQSFVGTFRNLSLYVSRQACHLYRQSIWSTNKILKEIAVLECKNARKCSKLARIYIDFLNVSVFSVYITVVYIQRHTISNNRELHWLYVYEDVIWDLKICVSEISTNRILKEIAVLECENGKSFRARSHNLFIEFLNVSVLSDTVVIAPYNMRK